MREIPYTSKLAHAEDGKALALDYSIFDEFQTLYLEPEPNTHKRRRTRETLVLAKNSDKETPPFPV